MKKLFYLLLLLPVYVFSATTSTLINSSSYTQILGPGGSGYLLSAYQPMQCAFSSTLPAPTVIGHTIQQQQQTSIDSIGTGIYLWCKSMAAGLNYATTTPTSDAATWGNNGTGGATSDVNIKQVGGTNYALGQTTMSASMPVTVASNQSGIPVTGTFWQATQPVSAVSLPLPTGASTNAGITGVSSKTLTDINTTLGTPLQAGGNVVVTSAPTTAVTNAGLSNLDVALSSRLKPSDTLSAVTTVGSITNPVGVTGTFWQATQPVSAASLPLPSNASQETGGNLATIATNTTGASTAANQTTGNTSLSTIATNTTGVSTAANQTTGNSSLSTIATNTSSGSTRTIIPATAASAIVTNVDSTAYEASHVISAAPANLLGCHGYSSSSSAQFILFFNSTTVPANATAPTIAALSVPATSTWSIDFGVYGRPFSTGIAVSNSSTANTKTIGSADSWFSCIIK